MVGRALLACSLLCVSACHTRRLAAPDAGPDALAPDAPSADVPGPLAVDFAVTGCARYDVGATRCSGTVPLSVSFSPVSSAALTRFLWTFGDGSPTSAERAPTHTYALPGVYDVSLVAAGEVGSVARTRARFVEATPVTAGATCDVDAQCATGLRCLCGAGDACGATFPRGLCTIPCPAAGCAVGAVCAALELPGARLIEPLNDGGGEAGAASEAGTAPDAAAAPTLAPLCLAACADDAGCPTGLVCRSLPATGGGQPRWVRACVPPPYREIGDSCRAATGALAHQACSSGWCADLGALGVCSATCGAGLACPPDSACATLGNGQSLCLRKCSPSFSCTGDPLLRCEVPGGAGTLGFQLPPPMTGATFCAPRACAAEVDCAPAGSCTPLGAGGHCLKR